MTAEADRVLARIDATLEGHGGVVEDYSVSPDAMRWAADQPEPETRKPGAWSEAILEQARARLEPYLRAWPTQLRVLTFAEIESLVADYYATRPPTRLRCHPSVVARLRATAPDDWPPFTGPSLVDIEVVATTNLPHGGWELLKGDEVISRSEPA